MTTMTGVDVEALKAAAEAATPGPWTAVVDSVESEFNTTNWRVDAPAHEPYSHTEVVGVAYSPEYGSQGVVSGEDAAFIALANPAAVLALITALEDATEANERISDAWAEVIQREQRSDNANHFDIQQMRAERDRLAVRLIRTDAERDGLQRQVDAVQRLVDQSGNFLAADGEWAYRVLSRVEVIAALAAAAAPTGGQETPE